MVSEPTRRLLGNSFELKTVGPQALKGFKSPVVAWRVIGEQENFSRFDASRSEALTPFVGRDGVPLFMEELTKSVLESGLLREKSDSYVLASVLTPLAIPSTLHDSLTARLDRLSPIKETAQIGAAIGREFSHTLIEAVSPIKGDALERILQQLIEAELIHRRGTPPKAHYTFKHAMVQDAAYGSMLRGRRQGIHAQIAWALKEHLTDEECPPATVAHHFTEAGLPHLRPPPGSARPSLHCHNPRRSRPNGIRA